MHFSNNKMVVNVGLIDSVKTWVSGLVPVAIKYARSVGCFLTTAADAAEAMMKGERLVYDIAGGSRELEMLESNSSVVRSYDENISRRINRLGMEVVNLKRTLSHRTDMHKLALMITELRISGELLRSISGNIELHASNLQIHLLTIKNMTGLVADVNRQRSAIYSIVGKLNHVLNVIGQDGNKIRGLDVEMRKGDISIKSSYDSYEKAQKHLIAEILRFGEVVNAQWKRVDAVAEMAKKAPHASKIRHWLNAEVKPGLIRANDSAAIIYEEIQRFTPLAKQVIAEMRDFD